MMIVAVRVYASLREKLGWSSRRLELEGSSCRLSDVIYRLDDLRRVMEEFGREHFTILLNGRNVRTLDDLDTPVSDGDLVDIFPPAAGGRHLELVSI